MSVFHAGTGNLGWLFLDRDSGNPAETVYKMFGIFIQPSMGCQILVIDEQFEGGSILHGSRGTHASLVNLTIPKKQKMAELSTIESGNRFEVPRQER